MPKKKTSKTVAKRYKKTAGGKLKHGRAGSSHLLSSKTRKRKRRLRKDGIVSKADRKRILEMI